MPASVTAVRPRSSWAIWSLRGRRTSSLASLQEETPVRKSARRRGESGLSWKSWAPPFLAVAMTSSLAGVTPWARAV